jgi:hypothetical protein
LSFVIFGVDPSILQSIGAFLGGTAAFAAFVAGIINRTKINAFLVDRFLLVESANDARKRSEAAERLAQDYAGSVAAMRQTMEALEKRVARLEAVEKKFDILVGWVVKILEYVVYLERKAIEGGADLSGRSMPPIPAELTSDVEMPGGIR